MPEKRKLRVVMIGVGGFGAARRERMRRTGLFDILASFDQDPEAMRQAQAEDGAVPVKSYASLLRTPGAEAAVIATGAKFHAAQVLAALAAGLHVFVEKPLCSTAREMHALLAAQAATGLVVGVGHDDHTCNPVSRAIKGVLDRGELGTLVSFEMTTAHRGGFLVQPGDWRNDPKKNPGGMLFQCGVHLLHELLYYFGPVAKVSSMMRYDLHTTATADVTLCLLELECGLTGTLSAYHVAPYRHTIFLYGTKANLFLHTNFIEPGTQVLIQAARGDWGLDRPAALAIVGEEDLSGDVRSFHAAVTGGAAPYPSIVDGARAVAVCFAAEKAARTGRTVAVEKIG